MKLNITNYIRKTLLIRLILCFILITIITLICSSYFTYNYFSSSFKDEITSLNHRVLDQLSAFSDEFLLKSINELALNIIMNETQNPDFDIFLNDSLKNRSEVLLNLHQKLNSMAFSNRDIVDSIYIHSKNNKMIVASNFIKYIDDASLQKSTDEFNCISKFYASGSSILWLNTRNTKIYSDTYKSTGDIITVLCSYPLSSIGEEIQGCVAINIKEDALNKYLVKFNAINYGNLLIIDNSGKIISHSDKSSLYRNISSESFVKEILRLNTPKDFIMIFDKDEHVVSFNRSKYNNWSYVSIIPTEMFYAHDYQIKRKIFIISLVILILVLAISNIFSYTIYIPFKKIIDKYRALSATDSGTTYKNLNEYKLLDRMFNNMSSKISDLQETLSRNVNMIRHNFLYELLNNRVSQNEIENRIKLSNINFYNHYFLIVAFSISKAIIRSQPEDRIQFFKYSIIDFIRSLSDDTNCYCPIETSSISISVIINIACDNTDSIKNFVNTVQQFCYENFSFYLFAGSGRFVENLVSTSKSYIDAKMCISYRFIRPDQNAFYYDEVVRMSAEEITISSDFAEKVNKCLKLNNLIELKCVLDKFLSTVVNNKVSYRQVRKEVTGFTVLLRQYIADMGLNIEDVLDETLREKISTPENIFEFSEAYLHAAKQSSEHVSDKKLNRNSELIESVKQYVMDNINLELSLNSAAYAIHISPYYLSKLFKEETKINYIDFVTNIKMEKAKELLLSSDLTIEEITGCIGYNYSTYFTRKFKECTGKTPNEYRKSPRLP